MNINFPKAYFRTCDNVMNKTQGKILNRISKQN